MGAKSGVLLDCNDEGKDRRRKIQCAPVFKWWARKRSVLCNDMGEGNPTDEDGITVRQLFKNLEDYCLPKKNLLAERIKFF